MGDGAGGESELLGGVTFDDPAELLDEFVSVGGNVPGFERVKRSVDLLLTPERVLSILRDFTLFEQVPGGGVRKLIPRYPQVEAAEH